MLIQKKRGILRVLSVPVIYIKNKVKSVYKKCKQRTKKKKKNEKEVHNEEKLKRKSISELKQC